jgi:hypothetical protein
MLQLTPDPVGSTSFRAAEVAADPPVLFTSSVYPMALPAVTVAASAVLARLRLAAFPVERVTFTSVEVLLVTLTLLVTAVLYPEAEAVTV